MFPIGEWISRRPRVVIVTGFVVWLVALAPAANLELRVNLESLLPDRSVAARGFSEFITRFGAVKQVFVIVEGPESDTDTEPMLLAEVASRLADILSESDEVVEAKAGLTDEDLSQFSDRVVRRAPLLIPGEDWLNQVAARLDREAIHHRVRDIHTAVLSPIPMPTKDLAVHDPLGFSYDLPFLAAGGFGKSVDPVTLSFLSPDNHAALVIVEPKAGELDAAAGRRLSETIADSAEKLHQAMGVEFHIQAVGGPLYAAHDEAAIRSDLIRTVTFTSVVTGGVIAAAFAGVGVPAAGLAALVVGLTWLAALMALAFGGVSAVAIGFSAVLIGLGIDSAIHGGAAFRRHLLAGEVKNKALAGAFRDTGGPILAAASTTAAAFAVLLASDLPLLRELGLMVVGGIIFIVLSTATLGAALAFLVARRSGYRGWIWDFIGRGADIVVGYSTRYPRLILASAVLMTAVTFPAAISIGLEPDLNGLRPENHPVLEAEKVLASIFGISGDTTTVLIPGQDLDETLAKTRSLHRALRNLQPPLALESPTDRIAGPAVTATRLRDLQTLGIVEAIAVLRQEMRASGLNPDAFSPGFEALKDLAAGRDPSLEAPHDDYQLSFDDDGSVWAAMTVHPPEDVWSDDALHDLQQTVAGAVPDAMVASVPFVGLDLRRIAAHDLRRLSTISLFLVFGMVLISFRGRIGPSFLALVPVVLGTTWALGIWSILGHHLNLVSLAVLPVMFGLGIDDGLYAVHGAAGLAEGGIQGSLARSGRAMVLTTITTCIGFGSLALSHLPALHEVAVLIPLGVGACLLATLSVLPAATAYRRRG